jgi:capsular exopolysaccharide synthesis family protein
VSQEVSIAAAGASSVVNVTATTTNPRFSATLANAYVTQLVNYLADSDRAQIVQAASQLQRQVNNLRATYPNDAALPSLETRLSQLDVLSATQTGDVQVANQALIPTSPSSPHVRRSTALGLVAGLLVGLIAMFLAERLDRTLRDPDDAKELFGLPLLGMIPLSRSLSSKSAAKPLAPTVAAEAFRLLLAQLRYFNVDREMRSVLVTSAAPGDGKSTVAWNLARTAAALNPHSSVLLVDADLRRSSIASMAYIDPAPGLAEALTRDLPLEKVINSFDVDGPQDGRQARLHVLTAGAPAPNPSELLESQRLRHLVDRLQSLYDLVIFDTPPTALVSDAIPLMTRVSGVIVVVRLRNTRRDNAKRLHDQLVSLGAPALGIVVNGVPAALSSYGGYPGYAAYAPATTVAQAAP